MQTTAAGTVMKQQKDTIEQLTSEPAHRFILFFAEQLTNWGLSRTAGQVAAALYLADRPLNVQDLSESLQMSRSTLSSALRELSARNHIRSAFVMGNRREHFIGTIDAWDLYRLGMKNRLQSEILPSLEFVKGLLALDGTSSIYQERVKNLADVLEARRCEYEKIVNLSSEDLKVMMNMSLEQTLECLKPHKSGKRKHIHVGED